MKILMVGEFWKGSLGGSYFQALKDLGCEVILFDEVKEYKNVSRLTANLVINRLLKIYFSKFMNRKLINITGDFKPDLCIIMKGHGISPKTISIIKKETKATLFNINADDPFSGNRGASSSYVRKSLSIFDCYFIWSKSLIAKLKNAGAKRVEYLPLGFDSALHYPVDVSWEEEKKLSHDLVFVGNWDKEREKWLKELIDFDLGIWGENYWSSHCRNKNLREKWQKRTMFAEDMSRVLNASKISLNILRQQNKESHNMRTFEAPACGAFVLSERSPEAKEFFTEDKEAVYFSTPQELRDKARYYLRYEEERKRIARAGYQRCIESDYSYLDRAKQVLGVYKEMSGK